MPINILDAYYIINKSKLSKGFLIVDPVEIEKDYGKFMKWFLILALTNREYMGPRKAYKGSSPEVSNKGLVEVD